MGLCCSAQAEREPDVQVVPAASTSSNNAEIAVVDKEPEHKKQAQAAVLSREKDMNKTLVINNYHYEYINDGPKPAQGKKVPLYGEYNCKDCGRYWSSTLSWYRCYQVCKECDNHVYPKNQRKIRPTDFKKSNTAEHDSLLCQKCAQLGYDCKNYNKGYNYYNNGNYGRRGNFSKRGSWIKRSFSKRGRYISYDMTLQTNKKSRRNRRKQNTNRSYY